MDQAAVIGATTRPPGQAAEWAGHAQDLRQSVQALKDDGPLFQALVAALNALAAGDFDRVVEEADLACQARPACALAWRFKGLGHEGRHEPLAAMAAFDAAYRADPASAAVLADLGRLAVGLGSTGAAAGFFSRALALAPGSSVLTRQLATALRDGRRYGEARGILGDALRANPNDALLWDALGAVLIQEGDTEQALCALDKALDLAPDWLEARYDRSIARLEWGDLEGAAADCTAVLAAAPGPQRARAAFIRAQARLAQGRLAEGWTDYRSRHDPDLGGAPVFDIDAPTWTLGQALAGKRFLLVGEQGLGDEMMFAGLVPEVLQALGPDGRLILAAAPRLVSLFQRSFPKAQVLAYETLGHGERLRVRAPLDPSAFDLWAPMGALVEAFRSDIQAFRSNRGFLTADPAATARWAAWLRGEGEGPKVGLSWKSMKTSGHRAKHYAPFADWGAVLRPSEVVFVNLQYGDCAEERALAQTWGVKLMEPPDLDRTQNIEGAAALSAALDLVIGVGNASTNLAAALGVETWFLFPPVAWPKLGTDRHPWFPKTRGFAAARFGAWEAPLSTIAEALAAWRSARV